MNSQVAFVANADPPFIDRLRFSPSGIEPPAMLLLLARSCSLLPPTDFLASKMRKGLEYSFDPLPPLSLPVPALASGPHDRVLLRVLVASIVTQ